MYNEEEVRIASCVESKRDYDIKKSHDWYFQSRLMSKRTAPQFYDTATLIHDIVDTLSLSRIDIQIYVRVYLCVVEEKTGRNDKSLRIIA